jgi:hypothetical protein
MGSAKTQPSPLRPAPQCARSVKGWVNYIGGMAQRPRYYANDHSRDILELDPREIAVEDARVRIEAPSLAREGFELVGHTSDIEDFKDAAKVAELHPSEIEQLLMNVTGADRVVVASPGVLRFGEGSKDAGKYSNSLPARFVHVDISDATAEQFAHRSMPNIAGRALRRFAHYNVWRALSPPPQDIPLTVCDARSVAPADLLCADAVFDVEGKPEWSFEGWVVRHNSEHRWCYFSGMTRDEALIFKTNDSDPAQPHCVPHSAFDDPSCPKGVPTRASIEMRGIAYWFD